MENMSTVQGPTPRSATSAARASRSLADSSAASPSPPPSGAAVNASASPRRYSSLRCERPHARRRVSSAARMDSGVSRVASASAPANAATREKMVAAAAPCNCWNTMARASARNARWGSCVAARAAWHCAMRGSTPASAMSPASTGSRADIAFNAARTSRTSPKDNGEESFASSFTPGLEGLERFAAVALPGVAGDAGGDAPDAGRARLLGGIEARRGRIVRCAGDFDTPGTAPVACAGRTTSAVVRRLARLEKGTARPRCMRRRLARGERLGESRSSRPEWTIKSDASTRHRNETESFRRPKIFGKTARA